MTRVVVAVMHDHAEPRFDESPARRTASARAEFRPLAVGNGRSSPLTGFVAHDVGGETGR